VNTPTPRIVSTDAVYADLRGKSVSVSGAARGLGLAMAEAFAGNGCNVQLIDIDGDELALVQSRLSAAYPQQTIETSTTSVTDPGAVASSFQKFRDRTGSLDIVVNNAGISANAPSLELDVEVWRRCIDINITGVFVGAQAAAATMVEQGSGVIINTSSMYGVVAAPARAAYCASKAAVASLTKVLAVEWAASGIRVNALAPGYVETDLVASLAEAGRLDLNALRARTPIGRLGLPDDIANLALFLSSDVSSNITGQVMASDGGWTADGFGITTTA
jgi:NAD(P)-dependent dehydrogenase (short-subunit alcohol dehydrogenase family)